MKENLSGLLLMILSKAQILAELPDGSISKITEALKPIEVSNEIVMKALDGLMTIDQAKKNPELFKYFNDHIEQDFNFQLEESMKQYKFDDQTITAIKAAPSMAKKAELFAKRAFASDDAKYNQIELHKKIETLLGDKNKGSRDFLEKLDSSLSDQQRSYNIDKAIESLENDGNGVTRDNTPPSRGDSYQELLDKSLADQKRAMGI